MFFRHFVENMLASGRGVREEPVKRIFCVKLQQQEWGEHNAYHKAPSEEKQRLDEMAGPE